MTSLKVGSFLQLVTEERKRAIPSTPGIQCAFANFEYGGDHVRKNADNPQPTARNLRLTTTGNWIQGPQTE